MLSSLPKETEVIWDTDHNSCHTLQRVVDSNEDMLIMEDDIELCKDFYNKALKEIEQRKDTLIMFYCAVIEEIEKRRDKRDVEYYRPNIFTQAFYLPA
jgi:GR25 family glycosyltransferase involved in LPS biosynthesis